MNSATGSSWNTRPRSSRWNRRATSLQSRRTASRPTISSVSPAGSGRLGRGPGEVLSRRGDGVRRRRGEEARGWRAEDAEERVHEDLDRLRRHLIAGATGLRALFREPRDEVGQDARLVAPEGGAARRPQDVRLRIPGDERERVDVEGADETRVEALEVEDEDVPVEARHRI